MSRVRVVGKGDRGRARTLQGKGRDPSGRKFKVFLTWHPNFDALLATGNIKVCLRPGQVEVSVGFDRRHIRWLPPRGNFTPRVTYHPNQYSIEVRVDETPEPERDHDGHLKPPAIRGPLTASVPDSQEEEEFDVDDYASCDKWIK